jgi:RNA polymerase sigma factor (sigma-70 family)
MAQTLPLDFTAVFREHHGYINRYLRRFCDHIVELEDAVQETFLIAWRVQDARTSDNIRAWLRGIARRVFGHMRRGQLLRPAAYAIPYVVEEDNRYLEPSQELAASIMMLREKFGCLAPAQAAVMNALADGYNKTEIGEEMGFSRQRATQHINLARQNLKQRGITL